MAEFISLQEARAKYRDVPSPTQETATLWEREYNRYTWDVLQGMKRSPEFHYKSLTQLREAFLRGGRQLSDQGLSSEYVHQALVIPRMRDAFAELNEGRRDVFVNSFDFAWGMQLVSGAVVLAEHSEDQAKHVINAEMAMGQGDIQEDVAGFVNMHRISSLYRRLVGLEPMGFRLVNQVVREVETGNDYGVVAPYQTRPFVLSGSRLAAEVYKRCYLLLNDPGEDRNVADAFGFVSSLMENYKDTYEINNQAKLTAWFPTKEQQDELANAPVDEQAAFAAELLGKTSQWDDLQYQFATGQSEYLQRDLGITEENLCRIHDYPNFVISGLRSLWRAILKDWPGVTPELITPNLTNLHEVRGFIQEFLKPAKIGDAWDRIHVVFSDGSSLDDLIEKDNLIFYSDDSFSPGMSASYDPVSRSFVLTLGALPLLLKSGKI